MKNQLLQFNRDKNIIFSGLLAIFLIELLRTAWISDIANVTLVTVLNFLHGYGPTFNIDERVQGYTHPIWFILLSGTTYIVRSAYFATYLLSISISLLAFWLFLIKFSKNILTIAVLAIALILSKTFVDFSTSGLEYPLSYLLIMFLVLSSTKATTSKSTSSVLCYFLSLSFLYLCKADLIILVLPLTLLMLVHHHKTPKKLATSLLIGALPAFIWTVFSLYYYGFLFSNPTYAMFSVKTPLNEQIAQGITYIIDAVNRDPLTIFIIFFGLYAGLRSHLYNALISSGIACYLLYIILTGGDFMSGRLLAAPLLLATILLSRIDLTKQQLTLLAISIAILGTVNINATIFSNSSYKNMHISKNGIADERGYYFQKFGLLNSTRDIFLPTPWKFTPDKTQAFCNHTGQTALKSGPGTHYVDTCALTDPLLSHLPTKRSGSWRPGNFIRQLPENYLASITLNENLLINPTLHTYYDSIRKVTRGDLNDPSRWREIVRLNF